MCTISKPKFKRGDKVRCLTDSIGRAYKKGEIYVVRDCSDSMVTTEIDSNGSVTNGWVLENFELIPQDQNAVMPIDELIRIANEGSRAKVDLYKNHRDKWEEDVILYKSREPSMESPTGYARVRISSIKKAEAKFTGFTVGENWLFTVANGEANIGCKQFPARILKNALEVLLAGNATKYMFVGGREINVCRRGLEHEGHVLSWEDAEKVYEALKAYEQAVA